MSYKQTIAFSVLAASVAAGAGVGATYYVTHTTQQDVKIEASVKIDENKLADKISEKLIQSETEQREYQMALSKRAGCRANRDNEYYLRDHCKGVTF